MLLVKKSQLHDYYISSKRKKQKGCLCSQWNWNAFSKSNYKKKHAFSRIIQKAVDNNLSEENTEHLICDRWNYSVKIFTAHPTPTWPTPPLYDLPQPYMTHLTPSLPNHPFMTYPSPTGPNSLLHEPPHPFMNHPTPPLHDPHLHDPQHPFMTHPTPMWHTPPHHFMTQVMNPLLHGLPALPQAMGGGFDPSSQEEVLGKISKLRGNLCANFWLLWITLWA